MNKKNNFLRLCILVVTVLAVSTFAQYWLANKTTVIPPTAFGDSGSPFNFNSSSNGAVTCGQYATGNITVGSSASQTSTMTGTFSVSVNNATFTTASENTSTVATSTTYAIASLLAASSSLNLSVATSVGSNVINVTSTSWGATVSISATSPQNGFAFLTNGGFPSSVVATSSDLRPFELLTNNSANNIFVCQANSCALNTGARLNANGGAYQANTGVNYLGVISCIATASSSQLTYTITQS